MIAGVYTTFVMLMNTWSVMLTVLVRWLQACTRRLWCWWTLGRWCWLCSCWIYIIVTSVVRSQRGCVLSRSRVSPVCSVCTRNSTCSSINIASNNDESPRPLPCNPVAQQTDDLDTVFTRY